MYHDVYNVSFGADVDDLYLLEVCESSKNVNTSSEKNEKMTV